MFQSHKVRLKVAHKLEMWADKNGFQSHKVRLKGRNRVAGVAANLVSIPQGSIKGKRAQCVIGHSLPFQSHKVRLKVDFANNPIRAFEVFQSHKVRLKGPSRNPRRAKFRRFNPTRFD